MPSHRQVPKASNRYSRHTQRIKTSERFVSLAHLTGDEDCAFLGPTDGSFRRNELIASRTVPLTSRQKRYSGSPLAGDTQRTVAALLGVDQATISRLYRRGA